MWRPHFDELSRHYPLIVPDLRGHGRSTNPLGNFTHRQAAADLFAVAFLAAEWKKR
jgi:pimeloyl-ACP methyl ester carboxylesterase